MARGKKTGGRKKYTPNKYSQQSIFHLKDREPGPMVYLLKANDRYKIGVTTNMALRFRRCIGLCPYPLELVWTLRTNDFRKMEKGLHRLYKDKRIHYEWFLLTKHDVDEITRINKIDDLSNIGGLFSCLNS